jgi:hypothetical protein
VAQVDDLLAGQAHGLAEADPGLDAAGVLDVADLEAVVVEDALDPFAAHVPVRAVGQDGGVLHRNRDLVVEAVGHPARICSGVALPVFSITLKGWWMW